MTERKEVKKMKKMDKMRAAPLLATGVGLRLVRW